MNQAQASGQYEDPESMWLNARHIAQGFPDPGDLSDDHWRLIKAEPRVRILLSPPDDAGGRLVSKIYRIPKALIWRTLFLTSRARREFQNLEYACRRGLPVVEPINWGDTRRWGCAGFSQLTMGFADGIPLPELMCQSGLQQSVREDLTIQLGELIARMHRAGLVWMTAYPRNIMVISSPRPSLVAFDFPYALCTGKDMQGSRFALLDLSWMMKICVLKCQFTENLLRSFYLAYTGGTDEVATQLRSRVEAQSRASLFRDRILVRVARVLQRSV
jgi:tRNA A-37 threonylcarbamoyl transferase component Bud32